ncbi:MAG TPA: CGNR zinc finger domain-containing protein [Gaiellaceae bacterium]|nr:CGNR zinc finger domain-containing protein [Gaiellaceae bacterium]
MQAFVNTNDIEGRRDKLGRVDEAVAWLRRHGLLDASATLSDTDYLWLLDVREALRALALANNGVPLEDGALAVVDDAAARTLTVRLTPTGAVMQPAATGTTRAVGSLLAIVVEAMHEGTWPRMKACRRDVCRWLFYDSSKNRASSWCSMAVCGNRVKTREYRRRRKGARP